MKEIIYAICEYYKIDSAIIFKNTQKGETIFYRHLFIYLTKTTIDCSYNEIAEFIRKYTLVKPNHATLINAKKSISNQIEIYSKVRADVDYIKNILEISKHPKIVIQNFDLLEYCKTPKFINN